MFLFGRKKKKKIDLTGFDQPGNTVQFGRFMLEPGKIGPIPWIVLESDGDSAMLLSKYVLIFMPFDNTPNKWEVAWENSSARAWLNSSAQDGFLGMAFTDAERELIYEKLVDPDRRYPGHNRGGATRDRVYLLSAAEAEQYFPTPQSLQCLPTPLAQAQGVHVDPHSPFCYWWLRTTGRAAFSIMVVLNSQIMLNGFEAAKDKAGIRPVIHVDLKRD